MSRIDAQSIVQHINRVFDKPQPRVPLHEPRFRGNEWRYVKECLDTGWVSSVGAYVDRFESALQDYTGVRHAIAVINGTAALHICLELAGVCENEEVLVPALSFVATANAVKYCGAHPHFIDVSPSTLCVDPHALDTYLAENAYVKNKRCFNKTTGRRIRGLIVMHTYGHPAELETLWDICSRYYITLVEDAAESLGSFYKGKHTGNFGLINAVSFNGNKTITTGGGGAILTNNDTLAKYARHITTTAKLPHAWEYVHDMIGYNYRLPNINAALGVAQLEQMPDILRCKRRLAERYTNEFSAVEGLSVFCEADYARSNYWLNVLLLDNANKHLLDTILECCHDAGLLLRPAWRLLNKLPMYKNAPSMPLDVSEDLERRILCLPSGPNLCAT
jgi:perosamine synthetase